MPSWSNGISLKGVAGLSVLTGTGAPDSSLGDVGQAYVQTDVPTLFVKGSSGWSAGVTLVGPAGSAANLPKDITGNSIILAPAAGDATATQVTVKDGSGRTLFSATASGISTTGTLSSTGAATVGGLQVNGAANVSTSLGVSGQAAVNTLALTAAGSVGSPMVSYTAKNSGISYTSGLYSDNNFGQWLESVAGYKARAITYSYGSPADQGVAAVTHNFYSGVSNGNAAHRFYTAGSTLALQINGNGNASFAAGLGVGGALTAGGVTLSSGGLTFSDGSSLSSAAPANPATFNTINATTANVSGALTAATATMSGALTAATATVSGALTTATATTTGLTKTGGLTLTSGVMTFPDGTTQSSAGGGSSGAQAAVALSSASMGGGPDLSVAGVTLSSTPYVIPYVGSTNPRNFTPLAASALLGLTATCNSAAPVVVELYDATTNASVVKITIPASSNFASPLYATNQYPLTAGDNYVWRLTGSGNCILQLSPYYLQPSSNGALAVTTVSGFTSAPAVTFNATAYPTPAFGNASAKSRSWESLRQSYLYGASASYTASAAGAAAASVTVAVMLYNPITTASTTLATFTLPNTGATVPIGPFPVGQYSIPPNQVLFTQITGTGTGQVNTDVFIVM